MKKSYTRKDFKKDLRELAMLIEGFKVSKKSSRSIKGGKPKPKKSSDDKRHFKVVEVQGKPRVFGRYSGTPMQAATKAVPKICDKLRVKKEKCHIKFSIQETTQGSKHKVYGPYKAHIKKNPKSQWVTVKLKGAKKPVVFGKCTTVIKEMKSNK